MPAVSIGRLTKTGICGKIGIRVYQSEVPVLVSIEYQISDTMYIDISDKMYKRF